jgi:uncharacterized protein YbbC (DUF1343 family)
VLQLARRIHSRHLPDMQTGLDRLSAGFDEGLKGHRIALLCNHTAVDRDGRHAVEILSALPKVDITRLLGPEHGLWSTHQDMQPVELGEEVLEPVFGLPLISLYGHDVESLKPPAAAFEHVDAVVYDIQDVGVRFYTYAVTLALTMEAAAEAGIPVWVLDRPNPIGPDREGPLLRAGFESFCGFEPGLPIRHGLTVGELASWLRNRRAPTCDLHVVPCDRLARPPWVPPSPNMPTLDTAAVYGGMCLLEATTLSEGRGTTTPFQLFGAPGIDPQKLVAELRRYDCPGVDFVPRIFRPEFSKYAHQECGGAYIRVFDRTCVQSVSLGVFVLDAIRKVAPNALGWREEPYEFVTDIPALDLLWGSPDLRDTLETGRSVDKLLKQARQEAAEFRP